MENGKELCPEVPQAAELGLLPARDIVLRGKVLWSIRQGEVNIALQVTGTGVLIIQTGQEV